MDNIYLKKKLSENLRIYRAKQKISQEKLAETAEISQKYITQIENEKVTPSIFIIYKIARALKITVNDLIY